MIKNTINSKKCINGHLKKKVTKSACVRVLLIVILTMGMNSPFKLFKNGIHKQQFEEKIVILTMGMNSPVN